MTGTTPNDTTGSGVPAHVETDLRCANCGYNLRTLRWDGRCPECGTPVIRSGEPVGFRFHSPRSENWLRSGIGILAAALLVEVVGRMAMTAAFRVFFVTPRFVYWVGFYAWVYSGYLASFAAFAAILFITQPFARATERFAPRFGLVVLIFASVGILGTLFDLVLRFTGLTYGIGEIKIVIAHTSGLCCCIAYLLACVHLLLRVDRRRQRTLWLLLCPIVVAQALALYLPLTGAVLYFSGEAPLASTAASKSGIL